MDGPRPGLAAILLTGGESRRMGRDKASIVIGGETLARRTGRLLGEVAAPVIEVGAGASGLEAVGDDDPHGGPLAAIATGVEALRARGRLGPAIVCACDLPQLSVAALALLADEPGSGSVL